MISRNLAKFGLDRRLYKVVTKYLDFQKYLSEHFKDISHLSLSELVKIFCNDQIFRLHCADEDSKALMSVFSNIHGMRGVEPADFMKKMEKMIRSTWTKCPSPSAVWRTTTCNHHQRSQAEDWTI